jgi:hypothetical protein
MAGRVGEIGVATASRSSGRKRVNVREPWDVRIFRWYGVTFGVLCVAYLFFDRGIAHFHPPVAKVAFIGELTLAFAGVALACGTRWLRQALVGDTILGVLFAYMGWGLVRTVSDMPYFGVQPAVRDAALWYYAFFGIALVVSATAVPDLPQRFVRGFRRVVPWLTLWLPTALFLQRFGFKGPHFRWSGVPFLSHRAGNVCCAALLCLAFLLLVPERATADADSDEPFAVVRYVKGLRPVLIGINLMAILLGATQTRGGGIAALVGIGLIFFLMESGARKRVMMPLVLGLVLTVGLALATGITIHTKHRTISASQLFENAQSLGGGQEQLSVNFRTGLWDTILAHQSTSSRLVTGYGYGPDLAKIGGVVEKSPHSATAATLQSAHNSLLDIFARSGLIGAVLFAIVWFGWFRRMSRSIRRFRSRPSQRGVIGVCLCGAATIFVNCFFDPTLEGAQVAAVLFALFGIGITCARMTSGDMDSDDRSAATPLIPRL